MLRTWVVLIAAVLTVSLAAAKDNRNRWTVPLPRGKKIAEYTATLFPEWNSFWNSNGQQWPEAARNTIESLSKTRHKRIKEAIGCEPLPNCTVEAWKLSKQDKHQLRKALHSAKAKKSLLQALPIYMDAINHMFTIYGQAGFPAHSEDGFAYNVTGFEWTNYINQTNAWLLRDGQEPAPFDAIYTAVELLDGNLRPDALRWKKVWNGANVPARQFVKKIDWSDYDYAAILVPGEGPERLDEPLSPTGKRRLEIATHFFNEGIAPVMVTSGGSVHPKLSHYVEAQEMAEWLVKNFDIPQHRIIQETQARHTTTNLRNTARIMNKLGAPANKPILVVTDEVQGTYILDELNERAEKELGYSLGKLGPKRDHYGIEYRPADKTAFIDPRDPMDP